MSYLEATAKAVIEVNAKHSEKYRLTNFSPACQFFGTKIPHDGTGVSFGQKADIIIILRRFGMEHTHDVSMPMDSNV